MQEKIIILDFGSQYTQLIGRNVREQNVYCEIHPFNHIPKIDETVKGVILSGSPYSVRDENGPRPDLTNIKGNVPVFGRARASRRTRVDGAARSVFRTGCSRCSWVQLRRGVRRMGSSQLYGSAR